MAENDNNESRDETKAVAWPVDLPSTLAITLFEGRLAVEAARAGMQGIIKACNASPEVDAKVMQGQLVAVLQFLEQATAAFDTLQGTLSQVLPIRGLDA